MKYLYKNALLISYPKSGRTWLRMILANILKLQGLWNEKLEMVFCRHWTVSEYLQQDSLKDVIFLKRNPADVVVSLFFEKSKRIKHKYTRTLSEFVHENIDDILLFMWEWERLTSKRFSISYEDLHTNTPGIVKQVLDFLGHKTPDSVIERAIQQSTFDKMREIEKKGGGLISKYRGRFGRNFDESDPESFRCRQGRIGGFIDYLSNADIKYINERRKAYAI
jgi:hypothetical protein